MNPQSAVCKSVTLFLKESSISRQMVSEELIRKSLDLTRPRSATRSEFISTSAIDSVRTLLYGALTSTADIDPGTFLGEIRLACDTDESTYEAIASMVGPLDQPEASIRKSVVALRAGLASNIKEFELEAILVESSRQLKFYKEEISDTSAWTNQVLDSIKNVRVGDSVKRRGVISAASFSEVETVAAVFEEMKAFKTNAKIFRFGWQGVNTMLHGGVRRGEFMCVNGLPHRYKSGFNLSLFRQLVMYNEPHPVAKEGLKPLVIRISFEDDLHMNFRHLYYDIRKSEGADAEDIANVDDWSSEELADFVKGNMEKTGFEVEMLRVNPNEWTFRDLMDTVEYFTSEGYEVQALFIDYLAMLPTTGCIQGAIGQDLRNLFQRLKNFASEQQIAIVTPHQINPAAKELLLKGQLKDASFVTDIVGRGLYLGCRSLDNEFDAELNIHLYEYGGKTWLTVGWAKHRNHVTAKADKLCVYEFPSHGMPIPSDLHRDFASHYTIAPGPVETDQAGYNSGGGPPRRNNYY